MVDKQDPAVITNPFLPRTNRVCPKCLCRGIYLENFLYSLCVGCKTEYICLVGDCNVSNNTTERLIWVHIRYKHPATYELMKKTCSCQQSAKVRNGVDLYRQCLDNACRRYWCLVEGCSVEAYTFEAMEAHLIYFHRWYTSHLRLQETEAQSRYQLYFKSASSMMGKFQAPVPKSGESETVQPSQRTSPKLLPNQPSSSSSTVTHKRTEENTDQLSSPVSKKRKHNSSSPSTSQVRYRDESNPRQPLPPPVLHQAQLLPPYHLPPFPLQQQELFSQYRPLPFSLQQGELIHPYQLPPFPLQQEELFPRYTSPAFPLQQGQPFPQYRFPPFPSIQRHPDPQHQSPTLVSPQRLLDPWYLSPAQRDALQQSEADPSPSALASQSTQESQASNEERAEPSDSISK